MLTLLDPERHCALYEVGPKPCRELVHEFAEHPAVARSLGLIEVLLGLALAEFQKPRHLRS